MSSKIEQLVKSALKEANKSDSPNFKIGCAAYRQGRVLYSAKNEFVKTSPCTTNRSRKLHAEKNLSRNNLWGCTVLVLRLTAAGKIRMAKPCEHCEKDLRDARQILYTDSDSQIVEFKTNKVLGKIIVELQLSQYIPYIQV